MCRLRRLFKSVCEADTKITNYELSITNYKKAYQLEIIKPFYLVLQEAYLTAAEEIVNVAFLLDFDYRGYSQSEQP